MSIIHVRLDVRKGFSKVKVTHCRRRALDKGKPHNEQRNSR